MKRSKSFDEICNLFCLYDGVEINHWNEREDAVFFSFRISDPKSIIRLDFLCVPINKGPYFYAESEPLETDSVSDTLRRLVWTFSFPRDEGSADLPEDLKHFGCHMVWDLQKRGILEKVEATRLLALWGGAQRNF